jgi:hypothetical protein
MPPAGPQTGSTLRPRLTGWRFARARFAVLALVAVAITTAGPARAQAPPDTNEVTAEPDTLSETSDADTIEVTTPILEDKPDTLRVSFELGAATEVTTEQFFEDVFLDSVALGLRRVSTPQSWYAGVWHTAVAGTRGNRDTGFRLENEASWGDRVRRDLMWLDWRRVGSAPWTWAATPRAEYRHDRTFGRDLEESRASGSARLKRSWAAIESSTELSANGEWLRSHGTGAEFVPDRHGGGLALRFEREPLTGAEWQLGYGAATRVFPDTSERDHVEQRAEAVWRRDLAGGHRFELNGEFVRRTTLQSAPTSLDRFRNGELEAGLDLLLGGNWGLSVRARTELLRYDERDTTVFFDYDLTRVELEPRWTDRAWSVSFGPRLERLSSPDSPSDEYFEIGGASDVEWTHGAWWSVSLAGGWREYTSELASAPIPGALPVSASRSSFAFAQLDVLGDQPLLANLRVRVIASGRLEWHTDPAQDARSLYISLDLRRLF